MKASAHQQVSSDQDTAGPWPKLSHDNIPFLLVHVTMLELKQKADISTVPMLQTIIFFEEQRHVWIPASLPAVGTKQVGIERKHFTLSRGNDNTALHSYIITFLLLTRIPSSPFLLP